MKYVTVALIGCLSASASVPAAVSAQTALSAQSAPQAAGTASSGDTAATALGEPGSELTVYLLTMGPGDLLWEKFGHNAIWIHDAAANTDIAYHWGLFDFADADFMSNFLKGNMRYSMGAFDMAGTIDAYRQANRTVWAQRLNFAPAQRYGLNEFLMWNYLPENRKYSYDYYRDNCSTRVRDALDLALRGTIRNASMTRPSGTSYRFHTQRLTQDDPLVYTGTLAALGHPVDNPISNWEEMFLPVKLMQHLRAMRVAGPESRSVRLVADERVLFQATRAPEAVSVTRGIAGYIILAAFILLIGAALWMFSRHTGGSPLPVLTLAAIWSLIAGVLGTVLAGLWVATNHVYSYRNENVLQATPLSLLLAVMLVHLIWRLRPGRGAADSIRRLRNAASVAVVIAALSALGFTMQFFPMFSQVNGAIIALGVPLHIGVAAVLLVLSRQSTRMETKKDTAVAHQQRMRPTVFPVLTLVFLALSGCATTMKPPTVPTLAIVNARVWTGNPRQPWADAVAVGGDRIAAVGSSAEISKLMQSAPGARVIDAKDGMLAPGFIDSHVHFIDGGFRLASVQLRDAKTPAEFIARIKAYAATVPAGTWITGGDWDHMNWGGELPRRDWIDSVTPNTPVWIARLDGHMALANSAALAAGKVTRATRDIDGGTIVRDAAGEPTGILKDNALSFVNAAEPPHTPEMNDRALEAAMRYVAERGVTSVHNMGGFDDLAAYDRAREAGKLITRVYAVTPIAQWARLRDTVARRGHGDNWVRIGGLKGFVDGSLGSHTAAMLAPFTDTPADSGFLVETEKDLYTWTSEGDRAGLQMIVHAIGDRAIRTQLDIFERVARENGARDRRFRIEHAQHIDQADIARFGRLGVIPSMQPYHAIDDGRWAEKVIGPERIRGTYAFRSLADAGARLAFGSDWFVAPPTPLEGIYAAVTRRTLDDRNPQGWVPEQKIGVEDALRAYTVNGAYASFEESVKGSIEKGKLADLVLIDRDLTKVAPETIREAKIVMTVVGGRIVHESRDP